MRKQSSKSDHGLGVKARRAIPAEREDTPAVILKAARKVLATVGYARLTMRAVAGRAGVTVGNLAYHFPSKRGLVRAVISSLLAHYREKENEYLLNVGHSEGDGVAGLVRYYIEDSASTETSRLFRELWVMALHDEVIAEAMDEFYAQCNTSAAGLLRLSHPGLDSRTAFDIVELSGLISEGANVIYATRPEGAASRQRVARMAGELLVRAAKEASQTTRRKSTGSRSSKS